MKHGMFFGSYELTLDQKHRLLVPSEIRRSVLPERDGEAFFVIIGINGKPWFYTEKYYEELADQPDDIVPGDDEMAFDDLWYGMTHRLEIDGQGRILVPDKILKKSGTGRDVTLVGKKNHLELWNQDDWNKREAELEPQRLAIALRAKQARLDKLARIAPSRE